MYVPVHIFTKVYMYTVYIYVHCWMPVGTHTYTCMCPRMYTIVHTFVCTYLHTYLNVYVNNNGSYAKKNNPL